VGCNLFTGIFTFHESGAVKRFVITTSVNQNLTTINKFQAANKFGKMTGLLISRYTLTFWKNKNVYAKVTRNCRWPETVEFTVLIEHYIILQMFHNKFSHYLIFNLNYMHTLFKNTFRICFFHVVIHRFFT